MENNKIKNVREVDLAISEFIRQMVKSGYKVEFNRFETEDSFAFKLRLYNKSYSRITYVECDEANDLFLSVGDDMWTLYNMPDLRFAVTTTISFMNDLNELFEYDED